MRLDQLLARHVPGMSRAAARRVLTEGGVFVGKKRVKVASKELRVGEQVSAHFLNGMASTANQEWALPIVFEDEHLIVIDKPSGLLAAPNQVSDQNNALRLLSQKVSADLLLVHRLDQATSGLLLFAKTREAAARMSVLFQRHDLERRYIALVQGSLGAQQVEVSEPLDGRPANTSFQVLESRDGVTCVEALLTTGRTHQVRRHALSLGNPIVGDRRYAPGPLATAPRPRRLMLHAAVLGFVHPYTGQALRLTSERPQEFDAFIHRMNPQHP